MPNDAKSLSAMRPIASFERALIALMLYDNERQNFKHGWKSGTASKE